MRIFLFTLAVTLASCAAHAEGDAFVIMPTEDWGDVPMRAVQVSDGVHLAFVEHSLNVKKAPTAAELAAGEFAVVCVNSPAACAVAVGTKLSATKVIASTLWDRVGEAAASRFELELVLHDLKAGTNERKKRSAADVNDLIGWAQTESLKFAGIAMNGSVRVLDMPAGTKVLVDGIEAAVLPMPTPLSLPAGQHTIQVRYGELPPFDKIITIAANEQTTLHVCTDSVVVNDCAVAADPVGPRPLFVVGAISTGVGIVGVAVGITTLLIGNGAASRYAESRALTDRDTALTMAVVSPVALVVGVVLVVGGAAAMLASLGE